MAVGALGVLGASAGRAAIRSRQAHWIFHPGAAGEAGEIAASVSENASPGMPADAATRLPARDVWIELTESAAAAAPKGVAPAGTGRSTASRLHGVWMPPQRADAPVLLYLHGARTNLRTSRDRMRHLNEMGCGVLGVDYRGFGHSAGSPSESGVLTDARAAWDWLAERHPQARLFVYGHSLGSAIAVQLVEQLQREAAAAQAHGKQASLSLDGLILEGAFTSIPDVVRTLRWGWLPLRPLSPLITQRFDSAARIGTLQVPLLVVHGSEDRLIPPELGRALYERATGAKRFVLVSGGTHHTTHSVGAAQYRQALAEMFGWPSAVEEPQSAAASVPDEV